MNMLAYLCFLMLLLLLHVPHRSADNPVGSEVQDGDGDYVVVSVVDFGAVGDGITDDTQAFVDAWREVCTMPNKNMILLVPAVFRYLVSPTTFKGPCAGNLIVQIDGTIVAPDDPKNWESDYQRVWLQFYKLRNTDFRGFGVIDGSGAKWWEASCKRKKSGPCRSGGAPTAFTIDSSSDITVTGLTIQNGQQMNFIISNCDSVHVSSVEVSAPRDSPNTDGIHITKSTNVVIKDTIIGTGDDCISIVSGSSNIKMQNIHCGPCHGISIGSLGKDNSVGTVENVLLDTAYLQNTTNGLRIKTYQGGTGYVNQVTFQNVRMDGVANPIIVDQFYCDSPTPCSEQTSAVKISNITYSGISGTSNSKHVMKFSCSNTVPCTNIVLNDVNLRSTNGSTVDTYCKSAHGVRNGTVQPPADCLSTPHEDMIISRKTEVGDAQSSKENIIQTEL